MRKPLTYAAAALMAMTAMGCTARHDQPESTAGMHLTVTLSVPRLPSTARSGASPTHTADECGVSDFNLLLFDGKGSESKLIKNVYVDTPSEITQGANFAQYKFDTHFTLPESFTNPSNTSRPSNLEAIVLTNTGVDISGKVPEGATHAIVQQTLLRDFTAKPDATNLKFHMWGRCNVPVDAVTHSASASLVRDMARVEVAVAESVDNFELTEVHIFRPSPQGCMMPSAAAETSAKQSAGYAVEFAEISLPGGTKPDPDTISTTSPIPAWKYENAASGNVVTGIVYIPEAAVKLTPDDEPLDDNHRKRPAIVVGGYYSASGASAASEGSTGRKKCYYRIDFKEQTGTDADGNATYELIDIVRNHSYNVLIETVSRPGADKPEDAYLEMNATVNAQIINWARHDQFVTWEPNGTEYLSLERKEVTMPAYKDAVLLIDISGNTPIEDIEITPVAATPVADCCPATGSIFRVEKLIEQTDGASEWSGQLKITTLHEHKSDTQAVEVFKIKANRLEATLTVRQNNYYGTDWEYGGDVRQEL